MPTTSELAEILLETAPEHEGWSLVESRNAAGRYEDLLDWAREMTTDQWFADITIRRPKVGLVLLWLESEVARRKCREGSLWPILGDREVVPWSQELHAELFLDATHATQPHRVLLRHAANYYSLRNTFEDEGQNWYRLIYLQFGFTHDDAAQRLAPWLSGQILPVSVQRLLEGNDSGAQAFQQLWRSLRMFRLGNLSQPLLESRLRSNPWVLPEWCADLIQAAKRSSAQIREVADIDAAEVSFFTAPRLGVTNEGEPYFTTSLCNLSELDLDSDEYAFKAGETTLARLIRQPDGTYHSDASEAIRLPLQPTVALSLAGSDGRIAGHDEALLWDMQEEVSVFSPKTGLLFPPGQKLRAGAEVYLVASADVAFDPPPAESFDLALGYRLHRIAGGWSGTLMARLDEDVLWTSESMAAPAPGGPIGVSATFTETLDLRETMWRNSAPPWSLPIRITVPAGWCFVRLRWRRGDGQVVNLHAPPTHLTLTEQDAIRPVVLRIRISDGAGHRTEVLRVPVPFVAALYWTQEGRPRHHQSNRKLLLGEAARMPWSFNLPLQGGEPRDPRTCSFLEGSNLHGRMKARRSALPDMGGYGARLRIVDDPYQNANPVMEVSPCVLDGGIIGNVRWMEEETSFLIKSRLTGIGPDHRLLAWHSAEEGPSIVEEIASNSLEAAEDGWRWRPEGHPRLHGLVLLYRDVRLGSWFAPSSSSWTATARPPGTPAEVAALLRVWKAPILQEEGDHALRYAQWLQEHWVEILPVWLATGELRGPNGFSWPAPRGSNHWNNSIGDLLFDALPSPTVESAGEIVDAMSPGQQRLNAIGNAVWKIAEVCPILAARVAREYLREFVSDAERAQFFALFLACPDLVVDDERAKEIGTIHGEADEFWLRQTVPPLRAIEARGADAIPYAYRLLSKSKDYRLYALGRWLREIH